MYSPQTTTPSNSARLAWAAFSTRVSAGKREKRGQQICLFRGQVTAPSIHVFNREYHANLHLWNVRAHYPPLRAGSVPVFAIAFAVQLYVRPPWACNRPVIRLNTLVLPAPFRPITEYTCPAFTGELTLLQHSPPPNARWTGYWTFHQGLHASTSAPELCASFCQEIQAAAWKQGPLGMEKSFVSIRTQTNSTILKLLKSAKHFAGAVTPVNHKRQIAFTPMVGPHATQHHHS